MSGENINTEVVVSKEFNGYFRVTGFIHGVRSTPLEVVTFTNFIHKNKLTCGGSIALPSDIKNTKAIIDLMSNTLKLAEEILRDMNDEEN